ncbi:MAG TPA: response regulator [Thermodesulfobacteriota bacterium]|nr:response regulator [Thermodesulfobacteriota bacterium]
MGYKQSEIGYLTTLFDTQTEAIRILLIEDNPGDVRLIRELLSEAKGIRFKMESAGSLTKGLKLLAEKEFDMVLLDLALPDCRGLEVLEKVLVQAPTVPIVLLTGTFDEESLAIKALRKGAEDYLFKGNIDGNLLTRSIKYAIERKRLKNLEKKK